MSSLSNLVRNCIGSVSIVLGIVEVSTAIGYMIIVQDLSSKSSHELILLFQYSPVNFTVMPLAFIRGIGQYMEIILGLMLITGGTKYLAGKRDKSGLLRFCYSLIFYSVIMSL